MVKVPAGMTLNEFLCGDAGAPGRRIAALEADLADQIRRELAEHRVSTTRIAALEAEVERLRGALAGLLLVTHDSYSPTCGCDICRAVEVGLAALEPQP